MWVNGKEYIALRETVAAQKATIEWMRQQINQLHRRNAVLEAQHGIPPADIPVIESAEPHVPTSGVIAPKSGRTPEAPSMQDLFAGNVGFEDMGDELAKRHGITHDGAGQLQYT